MIFKAVYLLALRNIPLTLRLYSNGKYFGSLAGEGGWEAGDEGNSTLILIYTMSRRKYSKSLTSGMAEPGRNIVDGLIYRDSEGQTEKGYV